MADLAINLAAGFPLLRTRQVQDDDGRMIAGNSSAEDKWTIGNTTGVDDQYRWIFIVDQSILTLTVAGAGLILAVMFFYEYSGRPATTRMRLVQSLVLSDLILGIVGMVGTSMTLAGVNLADHPSSCDGLGFSLVAVLWTEHMWTLALAIATYMILIYPLHPSTMWLERKWYWLWGLVWLTAIAVAMIGYFVYGYYDVGGLCYYGANAGLYGELMQFIPRAIVFVTITILYARLYVFLRRPDRIRASFSDTDNSALYGETRRSSVLGRPARALSALWRSRKGSQPDPATLGQDQDRPVAGAADAAGHAGAADGAEKNEKEMVEPKPRTQRLNSKTARIAIPPVPTDVDQLRPLDDQLSPGSAAPPAHALAMPSTSSAGNFFGRRKRSNQSSSGTGTGAVGPVDDVPPWEQIQLPIFHVDGERFGGSASSASGSGSRDRDREGMWSGWKGLGGGSRRHRPSSAGQSGHSGHSGQSGYNSSPPQGYGSRFGSMSAGHVPAPLPVPAFGTGRGDASTSVSTPRTSPIPPSGARMGSIDSITESPEGEGNGGSGPEGRLAAAAHGRDRKASGVSYHTNDLTPIPSRSSSVPSSDHPSSGATRVDPDTRRPSEVRGAYDVGLGPGSGSGSGSDGFGEGEASRKPSLPMTVVSDYDVGEVAEVDLASDAETDTEGRTGFKGRDEGAQFQRGGAGRRGDLEAGRRRGDGEDEHEDEEDDESDGEMDLMRMLAGSGPPGDERRGNQEASYEFVEESMASYLNRKTALLMLWFPLGYVLLFSVSLIRIIYDFAARPPIVLRAISRWFVFAQGLLDALIYGLVEWHTKRVVRKRVRKGTFNTPAGSRSAGSAGGSRPFANLRMFGNGVRASASAPGQAQGTRRGTGEGSGSGSRAGSASGSGLGLGSGSATPVPGAGARTRGSILGSGRRRGSMSHTQSNLSQSYSMGHSATASGGTSVTAMPTRSQGQMLSMRGDGDEVLQELERELALERERQARGEADGDGRARRESGSRSGSGSGSGAGSASRKGSDLSALEAVHELSAEGGGDGRRRRREDGLTVRDYGR